MSRRMVFVNLLLLYLWILPARSQPVQSVKEWIQASQQLVISNQLEKAEQAAERAVATDASHPEAWYQLATVRSKRGQREQAIQAYRMVTQLAPYHAAAWRDLGWLLWADNQKDGALQCWEEALRQGIPNSRELAKQVMLLLLEEGKTEEGIAWFERWAPHSSLLDVAIELAKLGRYKVALPLLQKSWDSGINPQFSGLYLAYANSAFGTCENVQEWLEPFLSSLSEETPREHINVLLEVLYSCPLSLPLKEAVERVEARVELQDSQKQFIAEIFERAAEKFRRRNQLASALESYLEALWRKPDRMSWIHAFRLTEEIAGREAADSFLQDLLSRATSVTLRTGVEAVLTARKGDRETSAHQFLESLRIEPDQPLLRQEYVQVLLELGRMSEAEKQIDWFRQKVSQGSEEFRSYLAEILMQLGAYAEAQEHWKVLQLTYPGVPYYAVEAARSAFLLCQPDEAVEVLSRVVAAQPYEPAYLLLAEIYASLGSPYKAMEISATGIGHLDKPSLALFKQHLENAESASAFSTTTLTSARYYLQQNPGDSAMRLLHARQAWALGLTNETITTLEYLVTNNPYCVPAHLFLKDVFSSLRKFDEAVAHSEAALSVLPWHLDIARKHALALAEHERWHAALSLLRKTAANNWREAIPVLAYRLQYRCPFEARSHLGQLRAHIQRLTEEGFSFVLPTDFVMHQPSNSVLLIVLNPDPTLLAPLDELLAETAARAVLAATPRSLLSMASDPSLSSVWGEIRRAKRWSLAVYGFDEARGEADKWSKWFSSHNTSPETGTHDSCLAALQDQLVALKQSLLTGQPLVWIYPNGNFGQMASVANEETMGKLRSWVADNFDFAFYFEDPGFIYPAYDPLRLPCKLVPGHWNDDALLAHVIGRNPLTRTYLDLAKVLYWNRQHELANVWFARAQEAGADPAELMYNWGANAYQQGDLATSRKLLRKALTLDPNKKVKAAWERTEAENRPATEAWGRHWEDNEDRSYRQFGLRAELPMSNAHRVGMAWDHNRWKTADVRESGDRYQVTGRYYVRPGVWVDGSVWYLEMESLPSHMGGSATLRLPNRFLSGHAELEFSREEMETVEALQADWYQRRYALRTYSRMIDVWDLFANASWIRRSDRNDSQMLDGRLVYRLQEWPFVGIGYAFRFADSDFDPPEYWAPEDLQQHQLYGTARGVWHRLNYQLSAQAGYAKEADTDWRFVWGARGLGLLKLATNISVSGELNYFEGPLYNRTTIGVSFSVHF